MKSAAALGWLCALVLALALRCPQLAKRPMHNDEAVNAVKFRALWEHSSYKYDPNEHHGPTLAYSTLVLNRLTGAPDFVHFTEVRFRVLTVLFGVGLILLLPLVKDALGGASPWAALFIAVSPAMVFYSRDYIHEMLLVFFTFFAMACGWRYYRSRKIGWAALTGAAIGLMNATKETFIIALVTAGLALALNWVWSRWIDAGPRTMTKRRVSFLHVTIALVVWIAVAVALFSSFFSNAHGPVDSLKTYVPWVHRAEGLSPHVHPWNFYIHRLVFFHVDAGPVWSEGLILLLAIIGAVAASRRQQLAEANAGFARFLGFYSVAQAIAYSLIPYKTPWCLLGFWHGMILLAGIGAIVVLRSMKRQWPRIAVTALLLFGACHLSWQAWRASINHSADRGNPYAYAETSPDVLNLVSEVEAVAGAHASGTDMPVGVIASEGDYWPLPWYLRGFSRTGWWDDVPADALPPIVIVSSQLARSLDENTSYVMAGHFELRPGIFLRLYVQAELWHSYLQNKKSP